ncbi:glycosyltransferase family 4 protein [Ornithinimicrobium avium]|uniref:Uncharacterized protein n=1 Tax=Ornithinimicrobium avium TaxID=2283195 RepID=A0A345NP02_9MICO|nr:glycosyltransferase family 4 protein [Ornithinimicrobium avium]AXH96760.1 hypothetical protein DV701_12085 [Ornithinimicrobium avium]
MPSRPVRAGGPVVRVRVLLLALSVDALPADPPWDPGSHRWPWTAAAGGPAGDTRGYDVTHLPVARPSRAGGLARAALARVRHAGRADRGGDGDGWALDLRSSTELPGLLRTTDVVWALDAGTEAALATAPELVGGRAVLPAASWPAGGRALAGLDRLLEEVEARPRGGRTRVSPADLRRWRETAEGLSAAGLPDALRPLDAVTEALRVHRVRRRAAAADRAAVALDAADWPQDPRGASGLAGRRTAADLSLGTLRWEEVDEDELAAVARAAVRGADEALAADEPALALARLGDALSLLFHRALHAEVPRSPLVEDPAVYLAPLRGSSTYRTLLMPGGASAQPTAAPTAPAGRPPGDRPGVLVVTGAYGAFHGGVVAALRQAAEVTVKDLAAEHDALSAKVLDPSTLPALAALIARVGAQGGGGEDRPAWVDRRLARQVAGVAASVEEALAGQDVVLADWADPATVWVSHLCPPTTRLVVRVHALDALDPWLHLVRWDRVERVVTVSEPLRSLVADLLAAVSDVPVPVEVLPHAVTRLPDLARDKTQTARTTLGMIGWGRRVKDVHWALDLLERDPAWELVLVGADFPRSVNPVVEPFVTRLRERLASPGLRDRVHLVGQVDDVGEPLRRIGVILSTSVRESWHVGLVEGAASGAVPVVRDWPLLASRGGPRTLFPDEWVVDDLDQAEARVRRVTAPGAWAQEGARAREQALSLFDPDAVGEAYRRVLLGVPAPD